MSVQKPGHQTTLVSLGVVIGGCPDTGPDVGNNNNGDETSPTELQLEVIELISNKNFKEYFKESRFQQFYAMLPKESFSNLKKHVCEIMSLFSSTYLCEQTFSKMKYVKYKHRTNLSDENLQATLLTSYAANKQFQTSH
ncbi:EPM2A-interacting protein 1-like [Acyrthosiphon pisum]|uniref:HAT C-terminal dimerisation domain-containing protein n=1 Tax=Acyrthosiphon pisum TaxID=7029 RepID=A0A8R2JME5_ACYPI|nr:EPM2A-interacting protein 1-like [Acyrthosiphon pisum]